MSKVLIIEDDEQISKVYGIKLNMEKIEVVSATDGEDGLKKIISEKPDLVLLDLMLPGKDGFWVLEEINKKPELKKIPVIVLSNLGQDIDKERAKNLGAKDFFVKADTSVKEMTEKIKSFL